MTPLPKFLVSILEDLRTLVNSLESTRSDEGWRIAQAALHGNGHCIPLCLRELVRHVEQTWCGPRHGRTTVVQLRVPTG